MRHDTTSITRYPRLAALAAILLLQLAAAVPALAVTVDVTLSRMVYQPNSPVKGKVKVTGDPRPLKGLLRVETFNEQSGEQIDFREYPFTLPAGGSRVVPYVIATTPAPDASYNVVAAFYLDGDGQPEVQDIARFGVRPEGFPEGVPDHILKAEVASLNVPDILKQLEAGADGKGPVHLSIGSQEFTVQVERQELLAPEVKIPGLGRPPTFVGKIVNGKGEMEEASLALFTVTNGQLGGTLQMPLDTTHLPPGKVPEGTTDTMWIQPLTDVHQATAASNFHLCYLQQDTIPPPNVGPEGHGDPIAEAPPLPAPETVAPEAFQVVPLQAPPTLNHTVNVQVYQDHDTGTFSASGYHWNLLVNWANQLRAKFANGILRHTGASVVKVPTVIASKWQQISSAGYGGDCEANLNKFKNDTEAGINGPISPNTLQILFSTVAANCGGIAFLGAGSANRMYSITRDVNGSSYDAMVLLQETGHNLDWHPEGWCLPPSIFCTSPTPHDPHLAAVISESYTHFHFFSGVGPFIGDSKHCTAMHGSYGGCHEPEPVYSWGFGTPLTHLAEGIARLFPGTP